MAVLTLVASCASNGGAATDQTDPSSAALSSDPEVAKSAATFDSQPESNAVNGPESGGMVDSLEGSTVRPLAFFYDRYQDHRALVFEAEQVVMSGCMSAAGFEYPVTRYGLQSPYFMEYGPTDPERASEFGYGRPEVMNEPDLLAIETGKQPTDPDERAAYIAALNGTDRQLTSRSTLPGTDPTVWIPGGCAGDAVDAIVGDDDAQVEYDQLLTWAQVTVQNARDTAWNSEGGQDAIADWSQCMARAGYQYSMFTDPVAADWPDPRPSQEEINTAQADVSCKTETHLVERLTELRAAAEQATVEKSGDALERLTTVFERIEDTATNLPSE